MDKELSQQEKVLNFFSNEGMNDIIKIIKSLEDSNVLNYGINERVKHEITKTKGGFLLAL